MAFAADQDRLKQEVVQFSRLSADFFVSLGSAVQQRGGAVDEVKKNVESLIRLELIIQENTRDFVNGILAARQIRKLQSELKERDQLVARLGSALLSVEERLEIMKDVEERLAAVDVLFMGINVDDLVSYAHKISSSTSAPAGWKPGMRLPSVYLPPAPTEELMRSGLLARQDEALSKVPSVASSHVSTGEHLVVLDPLKRVEEDTTETDQLHIPAIPAGWRPGDPILQHDEGEDELLESEPRFVDSDVDDDDIRWESISKADV